MIDPKKGTIKHFRPKLKLKQPRSNLYKPANIGRFNLVNTVTNECEIIGRQNWRTQEEKENACRENNISMLSEMIRQGQLEGEALERAKKTIRSLRSASKLSGDTKIAPL